MPNNDKFKIINNYKNVNNYKGIGKKIYFCFM